MNLPNKNLLQGERVIRATYDEDTITVYQAFSKEIALSAVRAQTFVSPPFKMDRMTWIKPSFLWMMYRSGWATKQYQECILAIKIKREGFNWAIKNSCLSHFNNQIHNNNYEEWKNKLKNSPVRIQWDPERNILLEPMHFRSIQIGLSGVAVEKYVSEWIQQIVNITEICEIIRQKIEEGKLNQVKELLPNERLYPLPANLELNINHSNPF
ncbi:MAG: hypothetical protein CL840_07460 [Crocinitomicaceae bacterium]|nr:hypothetical protein [Crocinitomicaceae bacterium]|tara:strand:+ start:4642 stop:5274 length:633 start_codon:yes stop_codon:yes gene_type:complete